MTQLTRHSSAVSSVYSLMGTLENDVTAALSLDPPMNGWGSGCWYEESAL